MTHTVIIGAGIGGLTAAALLLKAGQRVTVLEAHVYPGGSAGTFYHQGYRFDAGATLVGGFSEGGPHARLAQVLNLEWPVKPVDPAWVVHLPDGRSITQYSDPQVWHAERRRVFPQTEPFWQKQKRLADISWDISTRHFPWPPASLHEMGALARAVRPSTLYALPYLTHSINQLASQNDPLFKTFLDAQLLISAQTTSEHANALYGSAALDLPRRGVNHVKGGVGELAQTLVRWIRQHGGEVLFRQQVTQVEIGSTGRATAVKTNKSLYITGDQFLANLTPWGLAELLGSAVPQKLNRELKQRPATWGAFTLYLGLEAAQLPANLPAHHQVIVDLNMPLGEGNSVFVSLSEPGDGRAPEGMLAATLSTHTAVTPWWKLYHAQNEAAYQAQRAEYSERLLAAAANVIPGLRQSIRLCKPGTPITFQTFTRRPQGMVGGFPQTSIFKARGPQTGIANLWLVGDSIFPGQSTAGVTLGGMRVATAVLQATPPVKSIQIDPFVGIDMNA
ncbi:MAG: FAD-dependent oxidoreductase [Anaerolineales bacterium]|nr:FAD-dependent oxidoreductase [Anaerolineales bacterium]